jgi:hypothetical protein
MCVILTIQKNTPPSEIPTKSDLRAMWRDNPHGGGVSWRLPSGEIVLRRGITCQRDWVSCIRGAATAGYPLVAHARIATIGGIRPALTHPWPVTASTLDGRVVAALAHNGHWSSWDTEITRDMALLRAATDVPPALSPMGYLATRDVVRYDRDPWSDSRALALTATVYGIEALITRPPLGQRIAILTADNMIEIGAGWSTYRSDDRVRVSNRGWSMAYTYSRYSGMGPTHVVGSFPRDRYADWRSGYDEYVGRCETAREQTAQLAEARVEPLVEPRSEGESARAAWGRLWDEDALRREIGTEGWGIDDVTGAIGITARAKEVR